MLRTFVECIFPCHVHALPCWGLLQFWGLHYWKTNMNPVIHSSTLSGVYVSVQQGYVFLSLWHPASRKEIPPRLHSHLKEHPGSDCCRMPGVESIRAVLNNAKFQSRALCLRHKPDAPLQTGCPLPKGLDLDPLLHSVPRNRMQATTRHWNLENTKWKTNENFEDRKIVFSRKIMFQMPVSIVRVYACSHVSSPHVFMQGPC